MNGKLSKSGLFLVLMPVFWSALSTVVLNDLPQWLHITGLVISIICLVAGTGLIFKANKEQFEDQNGEESNG